MYKEDFSLDYKSSSDLQYYETHDQYIKLYYDGNYEGDLYVYIGSEDQREYIIINNTITYLETIFKTLIQ